MVLIKLVFLQVRDTLSDAAVSRKFGKFFVNWALPFKI